LPRWFDSHCHLQQHYRQESSLEDLISYANELNVDSFICVGTDAFTSKEALEIADSYSQMPIYASVGQHPHDAGSNFTWIESLLGNGNISRLVAIGECGLDYYYLNSKKADQIRCFEYQIDLAVKNNLALIVHCRDAWKDLFNIFAKTIIPSSIIMHCFTGDIDALEKSLDIGAYISFSGIVTFKNAESLREVLKYCPAERMLLETDSPFLAPTPYRGKTNQPAYVSVIGQYVSSILNKDPEDLSRITYKNTLKAFFIE
jgi:TatD DNase family protein